MNKTMKLYLIFLCTFFIGCVASSEKSMVSQEGEKNRLTNEFYEKALSLESRNKFVESKKSYELAHYKKRGKPFKNI